MFATKSYDYSSPFTMAVAYNASDLPEYIGEAEPGTAKSAKSWRIRKITYSGTNATDTQWAGGTKDMNKAWDDRTTYTYS